MELIRNIPTRLHQYFANWQLNVCLSGAIFAVTGCAASIFSGAPFFAICFAFLTGVCLFAAVRLQELGPLKETADRLAKTEEVLNSSVSRLENQVGALHTELVQSQQRGLQMSLQIAAYERTFEQNKALLAELHQAIQQDYRKENQAHHKNNEALAQIASRIEKASDELIVKAKEFSETLKDQSKFQYEEFRQLLIDFTKPECTVQKWKELQLLQERNGQLTGSIQVLEGQLKELEEKIRQLKVEADRFTEQNDRLSETADRIQRNFTEKKEIAFPINSQESKIPTQVYGTR